MPQPQLLSDHAARPRPGESSVPTVKKAPPPPTSAALSAAAAASAPTKKNITTRPASAPDLTSLSASAATPPSKLSSPPQRKPAPHPPPRQPPRHGAPSCATARPPPPPSTPAKNGALQQPARRPAPPPSASASAAFMAPRGVQTVRPARRLAPGTAVYVRTTFRPRNVRCRILLWLRARVVSASDAYHCTVKYAADLNEMFAGRVVSKPVEHVRVAHPRKMAPSSLSRRRAA